MKLVRHLLAALALISSAAHAGDKPLVIIGGHVQQIPTPDTLTLNPGTTSSPSIILPPGSAPTSCSGNNGGLWTMPAGVYACINGATVGPFGAGVPAIANNLILGNISGSTANATGLTGAQVTTLLSQFTSTAQGVVPASGGGTTNFLRADGTWAAAGAGSGVTGPGSSVDLSVPLFSGTGGATLTNPANSLRALSSSAGHFDGTNTLTGSIRYFIGNGSPTGDDTGLLINRSLSGGYSTGAHAIRDESIVNMTSGLIAYTPFDAASTVTGSAHWNHTRGFQARQSYNGSNLIDEVTAFSAAPDVSGTGTATAVYGLRIMPVTGTGPIGIFVGVQCDTGQRGTSKYCFYSGDASLPSYYGGLFQFGTAPQISASGFSTYGSILSHDGSGNLLSNPNLTIINGTETFGTTTAKIVATSANLQLSSTNTNGKVQALQPLNLPVYSAAGTAAPTCASGDRATASDATSATFGATYTSGGSNVVPLYCNGGTWKVG